MGKIFSLDTETKQVIQDALDDLLANVADGGLGKTCTLVYPPRNIPCDNCVPDPVTARSTNRPRNGSAVPFAIGQSCPMCSGRGMKQSEVTEEITLGCNIDIKRFVTPIPNVNVVIPNSLLETKGYLTDLPKIM